MGAVEAVLRVLEGLRQSALTEALGQVTCDDWHHEPDVVVFGSCLVCGAQL